jgi:hypothetical protein
MIRIPDEHVEHAFDVLKSGDHASARAAYEFSEKQLKVTLAKEMLTANGKTVGEREATALASHGYEKALVAYRHVAATYYRERDRREAASAIIDAYRTQQSDYRAMGKVG